jgi:hypothetical protein
MRREDDVGRYKPESAKLGRLKLDVAVEAVFVSVIVTFLLI